MLGRIYTIIPIFIRYLLNYTFKIFNLSLISIYQHKALMNHLKIFMVLKDFLMCKQNLGRILFMLLF